MVRMSRHPLSLLFHRIIVRMLLGVIAMGWFGLALIRTADAEQMPADLTQLSIEALMDIEITSLSKKTQKLSEAPAAVFVITQEDIRRSGATSIPEALRMVPGIQVARINANQWAITSRGFNGRFSNKLLVLMDGRSVYTPLFSGVFWEVQDTLLEDIDRIEVIRGPGGSIWGANAVNGVINIITKSAADTQGGLAVAGAGTEERVLGGLRYGGTWQENIHYRFFGKYFERDQSVFADGSDAADDWDTLRGGFRVDAALQGANRFMLQGEVYDGNAGDTVSVGTFTPPYAQIVDHQGSFAGGHLLGRWDRALGDEADMGLQVYADRSKWNPFVGEARVDTYDIDFQHRFQLGHRQEIIWGAGFRHIRDEIDAIDTFQIEPLKDDQNLYSGFIQDEIELWDQAAFLTLGIKLEHNDSTGVEVQPNARLLFKIDPSNSLWLSVSRAVRTPSRGETDSIVRDQVIPPSPSAPLPIQPVVFGNPNLESEELWAYEAGYRSQPLETVSLDVAIFFNDYDHLRATELHGTQLELSPLPPHLILLTQLNNQLEGQTYGFELSADWQVAGNWRLEGAYSLWTADLTAKTASIAEESLVLVEDASPRHQVSLRSSWNLPGNVELDLWGRFVDRLPAFDISSYVTLDARLAWKPIESLELALVGQNLIDDHHPEFEPEFLGTVATEIERGVYAKLTWQF